MDFATRRRQAYHRCRRPWHNSLMLMIISHRILPTFYLPRAMRNLDRNRGSIEAYPRRWGGGVRMRLRFVRSEAAVRCS